MEEAPIADKGYIYILVNPTFTNYVKIGRTIKDPRLRAQQISSGTGVPAPYQVVWDRLVKNCTQVERIIHQELSPYRARKDREFFSLSPKEAIILVDRITVPYSSEDMPQNPLPLASEIQKSSEKNPEPNRISKSKKDSQALLRSNGFIPARTLSKSSLVLNSDLYIQSQVSTITKIILDICPGCLVKMRGDGALIFVPPERKASVTQKNLITIWPRKSTMRLRIMPDPEEPYIPEKLSTYKNRLNELYALIANREVQERNRVQTPICPITTDETNMNKSPGWEKVTSKFHDKLKETMAPYKNMIMQTANLKGIIANIHDFQGQEQWIYPSDHCNNHTNKGACYCALTENAIFERIARGRYRVL